MKLLNAYYSIVFYADGFKFQNRSFYHGASGRTRSVCGWYSCSRSGFIYSSTVNK